MRTRVRTMSTLPLETAIRRYRHHRMRSESQVFHVQPPAWEFPRDDGSTYESCIDNTGQSGHLHSITRVFRGPHRLVSWRGRLGISNWLRWRFSPRGHLPIRGSSLVSNYRTLCTLQTLRLVIKPPNNVDPVRES